MKFNKEEFKKEVVSNVRSLYRKTMEEAIALFLNLTEEEQERVISYLRSIVSEQGTYPAARELEIQTIE